MSQGTMDVKGITGIERLTEVRLKNEDDIWEVAKTYNAVILRVENAAYKDAFGNKTSKNHSFYAVIVGVVIYKFVFDTEKEYASTKEKAVR